MKYNIGDQVEVLGTQKQVLVEDMEQFDTLNLYYTSDRSAYPEDKLKPIGFQSLKDNDINNYLSTMLKTREIAAVNTHPQVLEVEVHSLGGF